MFRIALKRAFSPAVKTALYSPKTRNMHVSRYTLGGAEAFLQENLEEVKLEPTPRINEPTEKKRARLLWQSRKRGILETCVILGKFAKEYLPSLSRAELDEYDAFMNENDWDIYYWVTEARDAPIPCPEKWDKSPLMAKMRKVGRNENREIMRQPDLE